MKNKNMKLFYGFLLIICVYMDFVQGGCLSYGHSCWGGHGKRGGPARVLRPPLISRVDMPERWEFIKTLPDKQNGVFSLYPEYSRKILKDADSEDKFMANTLQLPADNNLPFLQSLGSNNEIDTFSKEAETKSHQRNNNNNNNSNKIGLIKPNTHQSLNSNINNSNNNQGLDSYEDLSSSISVLLNGGGAGGGGADSDLQNIPIDDILEMKNMKILKMLTRPYETKFMP